MAEIIETGGARIGLLKSTWPFAKLIVSRDKMELRASIMGNLFFKPSDIISIQPYTGTSLLGGGIKIIHNVSSYNADVVFLTMGSTSALISRINETGFMSNVNPASPSFEQEIKSARTQYGFPMKTPAVIVIVVIWNLFFLSDRLSIFHTKPNGAVLGTGAQLALGFVFLTCLVLLKSEFSQVLILKPGRTIDGIKHFLYFIMFITGLMFIGIAFLPK